MSLLTAYPAEPPACPKCGFPNVMRVHDSSDCSDCGMPIYEFIGHKAMLVSTTWIDSRNQLHRGDVHGHTFCVRARAKAVLPVQPDKAGCALLVVVALSAAGLSLIA
jgi:hypothetical protein